MILEFLGLSTLGYLFYHKVSDSFSKKKTQANKEELPAAILPDEKKGNIFETGKKTDSFKFKLALTSLALPFLAPFAASYFISAVLNVILIMPVFKSGIRRLIKRKEFSNDLLISFITLVHLRFGLIKLLSLGVVTYYLGSYIQYKAKDRTKKEIQDLFSNLPRKVWLVKDDIEIEIDIEKIMPEDIIAIHQSEIIPTDGIIIEGTCAIDEHILTGEFQYAEKIAGDNVYASTRIVTGYVKYKVTKSGENTLANRLNTIIKNSAQNKTDINLKGEVWADKTSMPIFIAGGAALAFGDVYKSIIVLKSSIGNTVRLTCPLIALNYITVLSKHGILVKDARSIEKLSSVDVVLFDKTGTITEETPVIRNIFLTDGHTEDEIIKYAAIAEKRMDHPVARSIIKHAAKKQIEIPNVSEKNYQMSMGVTVKYNKNIISVGSHKFMDLQNINIDNEREVIERSLKQGYNPIVVAVDNKVLGILELEEHIRIEFKKQIDELRDIGIKHIGLVSGDNEYAARRIAKILDFDSCFYSVMPEKKFEIVKDFQKKNQTVCFIGDGINDTLALNSANVSISFSGAATAAADTAQVILLSGNLTHLGKLFKLSHDLMRDLKTNLAISVSPAVLNILFVLYFSHYSVLTAIALKFSLRTLAIGNAMLPLLKNKKIDEKKIKSVV